MPPTLVALRERLDTADRRLINVLAERDTLIREVASLKAEENGLPLQDPSREQDLLARITALAEEAGLDSYFASSLYRRILDHSVRTQAAQQKERGTLQVAFQGEEGCYSHLAARKHLAGHETPTFSGYQTFLDTIEALRRGEVTLAVLPVENSVSGPIEDVFDLIAERRLSLVGEEIIRVEHCLLAVDEVPLSRIRRIGSHPKALAQCSQFLAGLPNVHVEAEDDTAGAARLVAESSDLSRAAIAGVEAAECYGLHIIQRHIANRKDNFTRFAVVANEPFDHDKRLPHKTSLFLTTDHRQGALAAVLQTFAKKGLNLTRLESRPSPEGPWRYRFYLDIEGGLHEEALKQALEEVDQTSATIRVLGSYPRADASREEPVEVPISAGKNGRPARTNAPRKASAARRYPLASREKRTEDTVVEIGNVRIGGNEPPVIIAGPCSVESEEQIRAAAKGVRRAGGQMLRGGCFKPRTSPYDFQGLGFEGLELLHAAGRTYNLPIVTEVLHPTDVEAVARETDVLQIGARNMQNFELLKAVGRTRSPVLLKRGMMAAIDEWLAAAEYIIAEGNPRVILCERGIRTFETATRNTLDLSSVVVARERSHLPVIVDPSHAAGVRRWVPALAKAALAAGAHGLIVEAHPDPDNALSDGPQSLTLDVLGELVAELCQSNPATITA